MSINTAMLAGASGMRANSSALAAISDNIANVNTVGYKRLRNDFASALNPYGRETGHDAGGVISRHTQMMAEQGATQSSSIPTHMSVTGNGYFVVRQISDAASPVEPYLYTRAGQFAPDSSGYLRNSSGYYLYGWPIDVAGTPAASPTDLTVLVPVRVAGLTGLAEATSNVALSANLRSTQAVSPAAATYNAATNNMASGAVTPDFSIPVQVYDSQGGLHSLTVSFLKRGPNEWFAEVHLPAGEVVPGGGLVNGQLATGILRFTPFGQLDEAASTLPTTLTISQNGVGAGPQWAASLGLSTQTITLDIGGATALGGITNYDSASILDTSRVDGAAFGALSSVDVEEDGFVRALYANGLTRRIYQIPLATFPNYNALSADIGGAYAITPETGRLALKPAGSAGAGEISSLSLESSTVDLAEEFSNLILTQRAYSASSKIITTADEMLDELIRLKR
jgi:flagellar hook protein FlgE